MVVLVICIISFHYDLLHCSNDNDNFQDGFLDYSITEFWWNGTPGIDQTDRITPQYSFMPTPYGHGKIVGHDGVVYEHHTNKPPEPTADSDEEKTFTPFPNMTRPSYPFPVDEHTVVGPARPPRPPPLPSPWHINYPGLTPPPNFPSNYRYPTVLPPEQEYIEYSPSPTGPTPRRPSFTLPSVSRPKWTYRTLFPTSTMSPSVDELPSTATGRATTTPEPDTSPVSLHFEAFMKRWKEKQASEAASAAGTTPLNMMPKLQGIFNYDYPTEESPWYEKIAPSHGPDHLAEETVNHTQSLTAATRTTQGTDGVSESMAIIEAENTGGGDGINETRPGVTTQHLHQPIDNL